MLEQYIDTYADASSKIDFFLWVGKDILGGILLAILVLAVTRIVLRGILASIVGKQMSLICGGIVEISVALAIVLQTNSNPGTIVVFLGWSAAIFRRLIMGI